MYRKSYERECISWYMGTTDVFKFSKLHEPQASAIWELGKTPRVTIYHEMQERSYYFLFINILKKIIKKVKKTRPSRSYGHTTLKWLPNFSRRVFYFHQSTFWQVNQAWIFRKTFILGDPGAVSWGGEMSTRARKTFGRRKVKNAKKSGVPV